MNITNTYIGCFIIHFKHRRLDMENRVLRYFLAVVAERNISAAAKLLHITQPTLSRQIKDLEEELSVTLFNRKGKYLELTSEGHYLASKARDIINLVDKTTS